MTAQPEEKIVIGTGKHLRLFSLPSGWEVCERVQRGKAVAVVALTKDRELILVRQKREPVRSFVLELPAGLVDEGESSLMAAARELTEETGFQAQELRICQTAPSSPGMTDELVTFVFAKGCEKISEGGGVDGEEIEVVLTPVDKIISLLGQHRLKGDLVGCHLLAGLCLAHMEGILSL